METGDSDSELWRIRGNVLRIEGKFVAINRDGPVITGTISNLTEGVRSSPMTIAAVSAVLDQATEVTEMLVDLYSRDVAAGEVGLSGSGRATDEPILADQAPRALLYGRIQSGKTVSMILTAALSMDNGFRVVVVLTTDNVALVKQTASRFKDLDGPRVFAGHKEGSAYEWAGQEDELRETVATDGIVLVCAKNAVTLPEVIRFLQELDASNYPVLVLDDEADAATLDTTMAARSAEKPNAPQYPSTINRLVVANPQPNELGFSLGEELPHSLHVQVTATPYILFLQRETAALRPTSTYLLEPGEGYCGGEVFFGQFDPTAPNAKLPHNIAIVGDTEGALMKRSAPLGLARSINYFVIAACALAAKSSWPMEGFKHLAHTSHKTDEHDLVSGYIEHHLNAVRRAIRAGNGVAQQFFADAYSELQRSVPDAPALDVLITAARNATRHAEVHRINSKAETPLYGPRLNFLVGGNILGRGLTIDDLLVTYYVREAKTSQMDTVWQHARMYGYRLAYLPFIKIFLPRRLAARFREIHEAEAALRATLAANASSGAVLIRVPAGARPTRPNALEAGSVQTLRAGRDQVVPYFLKADAAAAMQVRDKLLQLGVPIDEPDRESRPAVVPLDALQELVDAVPIMADDPGLWNADTIAALLSAYAGEMQSGGTVYVRALQQEKVPDGGWWRGRLSGDEIKLLRSRSPKAPSLAILHSGPVNAPTGWYPTIVMPSGSPTYVFTAD